MDKLIVIERLIVFVYVVLFTERNLLHKSGAEPKYISIESVYIKTRESRR